MRAITDTERYEKCMVEKVIRRVGSELVLLVVDGHDNSGETVFTPIRSD